MRGSLGLRVLGVSVGGNRVPAGGAWAPPSGKPEKQGPGQEYAMQWSPAEVVVRMLRTPLGALEPWRKMSGRVVKSQQRQTRGSRNRCGVNWSEADCPVGDGSALDEAVAVGMERVRGFRRALGDGSGRSWRRRREAAGFCAKGTQGSVFLVCVIVLRWEGGTNILKLLLGARLLSQVTHEFITLSPEISLIRLHWGGNSKVGGKLYVIKYSLHCLVMQWELET